MHATQAPTHEMEVRVTYADNQDLADYLSHKLECQQCHASLPTVKLLEIHVAEMHDSYWEAQAARKMPVRLSERVSGCRAWHRHAYLFSKHFHHGVMQVFLCLVEGCNRKFCTAHDRRQHLTDPSGHQFPRNYDFDKMHLRWLNCHACDTPTPARVQWEIILITWIRICN
jgi:hypothetical protein